MSGIHLTESTTMVHAAHTLTSYNIHTEKFPEQTATVTILDFKGMPTDEPVKIAAGDENLKVTKVRPGLYALDWSDLNSFDDRIKVEFFVNSPLGRERLTSWVIPPQT